MCILIRQAWVEISMAAKCMLRNADVAADMGLAGKPPNPGVLRGMIKVSARFARRTPRFDQEDP
jgi:hypothetical protein